MHDAKDDACNNVGQWRGACLDFWQQIACRNNKKDSKRRAQQYLRVRGHVVIATTDALTGVLWTMGAEQPLRDVESDNDINKTHPSKLL